MLDRMSIARCGPCCNTCNVWEDDFSANTIANYTVVSGAWNIAGGLLSCTSAGIIYRSITPINSGYYTARAVLPSPGSGGAMSLIPYYHNSTGDYTAIEITWNTPVTYRVLNFVASTSTTTVTGHGCVWDATSSSQITVEWANNIDAGFGGFNSSAQVSATADYVSVVNLSGSLFVSSPHRIGVKAHQSAGTVQSLAEAYTKWPIVHPDCPPGYSCSVGDITDGFTAQRPWWGGRYTNSIGTYAVAAGAMYFQNLGGGTYGMCKQRPAIGANCSFSMSYEHAATSRPGTIGIRVVSDAYNDLFNVNTKFSVGVTPNNYSSDPTLGIGISYTGSAAVILPGPIARTGTLKIEWTIGASYKPTNVKFYVDGALKHTVALINQALDETYDIQISASAGTKDPGTNDEVYLSNVVYTES